MSFQKPSQNYQFPSSHHPPITQTFIDLTEETRPTRRRCLQKMAIAVQRMYDDDETEDSEEWRVDPDYSQKKDVPRSRQYQESQTKIETEIIDVEDDGQSHHAQDHIGPAQYEETMQIDLDDTTIADDGITPAENGSPMGMNSVLLSIQNRQWKVEIYHMLREMLRESLSIQDGATISKLVSIYAGWLEGDADLQIGLGADLEVYTQIWFPKHF
ncbi:hypothetical protein BLNAU_18116 [Blattamonas nauphoetae]|uniref:Uncharacterized protein n=1 Tax=Blattamonas nauphoetae TaxID=2049346 RepID=A0ABQ9X5B3_9EUKA|nr:hypothetical protein BLNAU_18116 [Blattamonas nauphoetae]